MKVLIACEFSGKVRDAFIKRGYDATSCDLEDSRRPGPHYKGDVRDILHDGWDLMVAHPPCTYLTNAGVRYWKDRQPEQEAALEFVKELLNAPIDSIALENPRGIIGTKYKRPTQSVNPWQFGHPDKKMTCLWLKNLPRLQPTNVVQPTGSLVLELPRTPDRGKIRSVTYTGIAEAMAEQWGAAVEQRLTTGIAYFK